MHPNNRHQPTMLKAMAAGASLRTLASESTIQMACRSFSRVSLNNIADNEGSKRTAKRVGRGIGSGKGKTAGRGHNGQLSRSGGKLRRGFEGGQTPLYRAIPKRGFKNTFQTPMEPLSLSKLQDMILMGRIDANERITLKTLRDAGAVTKSLKHGVKLLGTGKENFMAKVNIDISRASSSAIRAVEQAGGEVTTVHYNRLALRALLKPEKFEVLPRFAKPPPKLMRYYTSDMKRGYLSSLVQARRAGLTDIAEKLQAEADAFAYDDDDEDDEDMEMGEGGEYDAKN